jgi:hypothetical protein
MADLRTSSKVRPYKVPVPQPRFSSVRRLREFQVRDLRAGMSGLVKQSLPNICTGAGSPGHSSSGVVCADSKLEMSLKIQTKVKTRILGVIGPNSSLASQRIPIGISSGSKGGGCRGYSPP